MILTRRKILQSVKLLNGICEVTITSITESTVNGENVLIFKFNSDLGPISHTILVNDKLHSILCDLMYYCDIKEYTGLEQFIGCQLRAEIINTKLKYLIK